MNFFKDIKALADNSVKPVIDALSEMNHPCQILCDLQTIKEKKGELKGLTLAYFGDCENNVTYSLMHGCAHMGMNIRVCCPDNPEVKPQQRIIDEAKEIAARTGGSVEVVHEAVEGAKDVDVIYTDSWMSYHIDKEKAEARKNLLMPFQVNAELMKHAKPDAIFMNCLPAMRGWEQSAEVIDGQQSVVFDQAENRLHAQKALILKLMGKLD